MLGEEEKQQNISKVKDLWKGKKIMKTDWLKALRFWLACHLKNYKKKKNKKEMKLYVERKRNKRIKKTQQG